MFAQLRLFLLATLVIGASQALAKTEALWVEAVGHAEMRSSADKDSARRRALADALVEAALAGGAKVAGHTAMTNAVITSDYALVRPTGRVLKHSVTSAKLTSGVWQVRIKALVGPQEEMTCQKGRHIPISIYPPNIMVDYAVPAWFEPLGHELAELIKLSIREHPAASIDQIMPYAEGAVPTPRVAAEFDYASLTRGTTAARTVTGYSLNTQISVRRGFDDLGLPGIVAQIALTLRAPDGRASKHIFDEKIPMPSTVLTRTTGQSRFVLETKIRRAVKQDVTKMLDRMGCESTQTFAKLVGDSLTVPYGTDHGLRQGSLAFVSDSSSAFDVLEITQLGARFAKLRPLDPTRSSRMFDNKPIYFVGGQL